MLENSTVVDEEGDNVVVSGEEDGGKEDDVDSMLVE